MEDFVRQGLLLPELTIYRRAPLSTSKRATVHFYVFTTPKFDYLEMPVRPLIENAVKSLATGKTLDDAKLAMVLNNF